MISVFRLSDFQISGSAISSRKNNHKPSRIVVGVEVNSKYAEVYADRYFKDSWGRLTAGRVEAIMDSLPDELSVTENETHAGSIYYTIDENCMDKWLKAAKALL